MTVIINFLKKEAVEKVLQFFNNPQSDRLQTNDRSLKEFEWLFINSFYKSSLYAIASDSESGEIIGTNAGIFIPMRSKNGEIILTLKSEDTLISLDRMIGLGKKDILKEMLESIAAKSEEDNAVFIWGFTPVKSAYKRSGFKIVTRIMGSFYVTRPVKFYKNRIESFPQFSFLKKLQLFAFAWYNYLNIRLKGYSSHEFLMEKISFDEVDEKTILSFLPENVITTYLSKDFLRWRIKENPASLNYGFIRFNDRKNETVAYCIFSSNQKQVFFIEQFLFSRHLSDREKVRIMKSAFDYCRGQGAIMIRAMGLTHNEINRKEMSLLKRTGFHFFDNPEESYFIFKNLSSTEIKPEDIYLSRLNTQGIR